MFDRLPLQLTHDRAQNIMKLKPEEAEAEGYALAENTLANPVPLELIFLNWQDEAEAGKELLSKGDQENSADPEIRWRWAYGLKLFEYLHDPTNWERLNPNTRQIRGITKRERFDISIFVEGMEDFYRNIPANERLCNVCMWRHDPELTNIRFQNIGPFVFPSGSVQNNILRRLHSRKASGQSSVSRDDLNTDNDNELFEIFRYTNKEAYHHLISTKNRMVRLMRPGEWDPSVAPKKPRKAPKSSRNAMKR